MSSPGTKGITRYQIATISTKQQHQSLNLLQFIMLVSSSLIQKIFRVLSQALNRDTNKQDFEQFVVTGTFTTRYTDHKVFKYVSTSAHFLVLSTIVSPPLIKHKSLVCLQPNFCVCVDNRSSRSGIGNSGPGRPVSCGVQFHPSTDKEC